MPVFYDILDNKVLGREYKRGHLEGHEEGERFLLRRMVERRFGGLPDWASERLAQLSEQDLQMSACVFRAHNPWSNY